MLLNSLDNPLLFVFSLIAIVIAITVHEFAHAYAADRLGDPTPGLQGRVTLNPLAHLDPLGSLMLLFIGFGWGKPVQFDPFNLRHPRRDAAIISFAGPLSNIVMAIIASVAMHLFILNPTFPALILGFLASFITINIALAVFNLIPVHPLDGFKIVGGLLDEEQARHWYELERYGFVFLLVLLLPIANGSSPISQLISPIIRFLVNILLPSVPFV
jgi:Zn-dependent protease